jgi:two-component system sensor histidine kinase HydH
MSSAERRKVRRRFDLVRWFAASGFIAVAVLSAATATYFTRLLTSHALKNDANVMTEFVNSIIRPDTIPPAAGAAAAPGEAVEVQAFFAQLSKVPGIIRANVYSRDQRILWSSEPSLVDQRFSENEELKVALTGTPVAHLSDHDEHAKEEHVSLPTTAMQFVEYYLPIWKSESDMKQVIAVAEIYRVPFKLLTTLEQIRVSVWVSALLGGMFLFACLFWIVRRGAKIIATQDAQLINTQRLVTIGEMAATVAHSLRNPLSSIRSSAELARENGNPVDTNHALDQIMLEADMMESWVLRYLGLMSDQAEAAAPCSLREVVNEATGGLARHPLAKGVTFERVEPDDDLKVNFNPVVLLQIVSGVLCNALEARPVDHKVRIQIAQEGKPPRVVMHVTDRGSGIRASDLKRVFDPFFTTKRNGLGIGLALTRQILERNQGRIEIRSDKEQGTVVSIYFAAGAA